MKRLLLTAGVLLSGCANPGIVAMSQDTYMLARADHAGIFGNAAAMKADVIAEANRFAESKGKVAVPLAVHETPNYPGHFATVEYQFRLVDPTDPAARGGSLQAILPMQQTKASVDVHTDQAKPDVYAELLKLDDLRKRGIITDAEFDEQKKRLLAGK